MASVTNNGLISVVANATAFNVQGGPAVGGTTTTPAFASATALGIGQVARGTEATLNVANNGTIDVAANAYASGATGATAVASAQGIVQDGSAIAQYGTFTAELGYATNVGGGGGRSSARPPLPDAGLTGATNLIATPVGAVYETVTNSGAVNVSAAATAVAGSSAYGCRGDGCPPGRGRLVRPSRTSTTPARSSAFGSANASGTAAYAALMRRVSRSPLPPPPC